MISAALLLLRYLSTMKHLLALSLLVLGCTANSPSVAEENGDSSQTESSSVRTSSKQVHSSETPTSSTNALSSSAQKSSSSKGLSYGTVKDSRDNKSYRTVKIGTQTWFADNLNVGAMGIGTQEQDDEGAIEKYCYNDEASNCDVAGGLYQWAEAMDLPYICNTTNCSAQIQATKHQGICPENWHIPTKKEFQALNDFLDPGSLLVAGASLKASNTGKFMWDEMSNNGNPYGFSAVPTGWRTEGMSFDYQYSSTWFTSATLEQFDVPYAPSLEEGSSGFSNNPAKRTYGMSVRCIAD